MVPGGVVLILCACLFLIQGFAADSTINVGSIDAPCAQYNASAGGGCAGCVALAQCGYCPSSGLCLAGDERGPTGGATCASADAIGWQFGVCFNCSAVATCGACAATGGLCGWCTYGAQCFEGYSNTTVPAGCIVGWQYGAPCRDCETQSSCQTCLDPNGYADNPTYANYACGFCQSNERCVTLQPVDYQTNDVPAAANCSAAMFKSGATASAGICPCMVDDCADCAELRGLPSQQCGFCFRGDSRQGCYAGTPDGPFVADLACAVWSWYEPSQCPICTAVDTCFDCLDLPNCLWCAASSSCVAGAGTEVFAPDSCPVSGLVGARASCPGCGPWVGDGNDAASAGVPWVVYAASSLAATVLCALCTVAVVVSLRFALLRRRAALAEGPAMHSYPNSYAVPGGGYPSTGGFGYN
jgi:hypothetical protein